MCIIVIYGVARQLNNIVLIDLLKVEREGSCLRSVLMLFHSWAALTGNARPPYLTFKNLGRCSRFSWAERAGRLGTYGKQASLR